MRERENATENKKEIGKVRRENGEGYDEKDIGERGKGRWEKEKNR